MMVGGVAALLLQMLHPAALAGVWDHSDFRSDMSGRLRRTARFLSGTTFGTTEQAMALIARVRKIHGLVSGTLPDGRPYSANDPELLTWVHVAGTWSFLRSFIRHGERLTGGECDRYFAETAVIARKLGARSVPTRQADARAYLESMRPVLAADARTHTVAARLLSQPAPNFVMEPFRALIMRAGAGLLPDWAARMHELESRRPRLVVDGSVRAVRAVARWALRPP
jgi:uncharacterized protein (DUF2236 family)